MVEFSVASSAADSVSRPFRVLLTGDAPEQSLYPFTHFMQAAYDVVVLPHHGSATNCTLPLFRAIPANTYLVPSGTHSRTNFVTRYKDQVVPRLAAACALRVTEGRPAGLTPNTIPTLWFLNAPFDRHAALVNADLSLACSCYCKTAVSKIISAFFSPGSDARAQARFDDAEPDVAPGGGETPGASADAPVASSSKQAPVSREECWAQGLLADAIHILSSSEEKDTAVALRAFLKSERVASVWAATDMPNVDHKPLAGLIYVLVKAVRLAHHARTLRLAETAPPDTAPADEAPFKLTSPQSMESVFQLPVLSAHLLELADVVAVFAASPHSPAPLNVHYLAGLPCLYAHEVVANLRTLKVRHSRHVCPMPSFEHALADLSLAASGTSPIRPLEKVDRKTGFRGRNPLTFMPVAYKPEVAAVNTTDS
jgi:hypothetical protein